MSTAVLLLAHGSRENDTEKTMEQIRDYVKSELNLELVEEAYLQFRHMNLERGLMNLVDKGATDIKIIPYFLFEGVHIKEDIPAEIDAFLQKHPGIKVTLGHTLGPDKRLAMVAADRVREILN